VSQLEITIIGDASADPRSIVEKTKVLRTLEKYQLINRTRLLGYQPHAVLFAEAYKHHIFISPSITASDGDTEGGAPVTIIEMAASGMPIVSTKHCDIPSVVIDGETGFLAAERDADGLLSHLRWLVGHPEQWRRITDKGRLHIEAEYDVVNQCERLAQTYLTLARGSEIGNDVQNFQ
jgi:colanic acid/amylovoran biosynthesis glycosyltransferase